MIRSLEAPESGDFGGGDAGGGDGDANVDADSHRAKRTRTLRTMFEDLPEELVGLVFTHLTRLDYLQFRVLRRHPLFARFVNRSHMVLRNTPTARRFRELPDVRYTQYVHLADSFIQQVQQFKDHLPLNAGELTVFFEFDSKEWSTRRVLHTILEFCHYNGIYLVIYDVVGDALETHLKSVGKYEFELIQNNRGNFTSFSIVMAHRAPKAKITLMRYPEVMGLEYRPCEQVHDFLNMNGVVWNHTLENLRVFKFFHQSQKVLSYFLERKLIMHIRELVILISTPRDCIKQRNISNLKLPKLIKLNVLSLNVANFNNNDLPSLEVLSIEGPPSRVNGSSRAYGSSQNVTKGLSFLDNNLPRLKILDISTDLLRDFESDKCQLNQLERFRLDTNFIGMYGTMGYLFNTFCHAKHISFIPRDESDAAEMMELFMGGLYDCSHLESLLIANHTEDKWLCELEKKQFPALRSFYYYNAKTTVKTMPQLNAPSLELLVLFNTKIERVITRGYRGPMKLVYTPTDGCLPDYYANVHFSGERYIVRDCCNSQYCIEWLHPPTYDVDMLTRKENLITLASNEPFEFGTIDLRYHLSDNIKDKCVLKDPYLIDFEAQEPINRRERNMWWY